MVENKRKSALFKENYRKTTGILPYIWINVNRHLENLIFFAKNPEITPKSQKSDRITEKFIAVDKFL